MKLTTYDNQEITVTKDQAKKLADVAGLIEINQPGGKVYLAPGNIASIVTGGDMSVIKKIEAKNEDN